MEAAETTPVRLRFSEVAKRFGETEALGGVTFVVTAGEIYGLLGPNGAGKTTALNCIAGLCQPDRGNVEIDGFDAAADRRAAAARLAFIPDTPYLPEKLSVVEVGEFALGLRGLRRSDARHALAPWLDRFGLAARERALVGELSHGMRQKLVFCLSLAADTGLLIIDEPMVGLDVPAQRLVLEVLAERAALGTAVLVTTHTLSVAERLCHRVGILTRGRLLAEGSPRELAAVRHRPDLEEVFLEVIQADGPHA